MADLSQERAGGSTVDASRTFVSNANAARDFRGEPSFAEICRRAGTKGYALEPSHVSRILRGAHTPGIDYIAGIAAALDFRPWQLLVPGFEPSSPPRILTSRQAAIIDQLAAGAGGK